MHYIAIIIMLCIQTIKAQRQSLKDIEWLKDPVLIWQIPNDIFPAERALTNIGGAIGYYQNEIFIIGSQQDADSCPIWTYDIAASRITNADTATFANAVYGKGQYWTQIENILYFIPNAQSKSVIYSYDLAEKHRNKITEFVQIFNDACLASIQQDGNSYLAVIGGKDAQEQLLSKVTLFNVQTPEVRYGNTLNYSQSASACISNGEYLYAIDRMWIERMEITNLKTKLNSLPAWETYGKLNSIALNARAVAVDQFILVIPGEGFKDVQIIDTTQNAKNNIIPAQSLNYPATASSVIRVDNVIYTFGDHYLETLTLPGISLIDWRTSLTPSPLWAPSSLIMNGMAGHYKDEIILLGGDDSKHQSFIYHISNSSIEYVPNLLKTNWDNQTQGQLQYWTQLGEFLFFVPATQFSHASNIYAYSLKKHHLWPKWKEIDKSPTYQQVCLTSTEQTVQSWRQNWRQRWLMIVGGTKPTNGGNSVPLNDALFYRMQNDQTGYEDLWIHHQMQNKRSDHACIAHDEMLYAIGGYDGNAPLMTIETMNISTLFQRSPRVTDFIIATNELLLQLSSGARAVSLQHYIMVINGQRNMNVQLIDTNTGKVAVAQSLHHGHEASSVIKVDNVIYSFGNQYLETLTLPFPFFEWQISSTPSPIWDAKVKYTSSSCGMVGHYGNVIVLLGGLATQGPVAPGPKNFPYPGWIYDISKSTITINSTIIPAQTEHNPLYFGNSQFYTQLDDYLYFVSGATSTEFFKYDLKNLKLEPNGIPIQPDGKYADACLASTMQSGQMWLMIIGGQNGDFTSKTALSTALFYHINGEADEWYGNTMNEKRHKGACIVHEYDKKVYAIGGIPQSAEVIGSIESFDVSGLLSPNVWDTAWVTEKDFEFTGDGFHSRAVSFDHYIMVIPGKFVSHQKVQLLDTINGAAISIGKMHYSAAASSVIKVDNIIYSFGNQYLETLTLPILPTTAPTLSPSLAPSLPPSNVPSSAPTMSPTTAPPSTKPVTPNDPRSILASKLVDQTPGIVVKICKKNSVDTFVSKSLDIYQSFECNSEDESLKTELTKSFTAFYKTMIKSFDEEYFALTIDKESSGTTVQVRYVKTSAKKSSDSMSGWLIAVIVTSIIVAVILIICMLFKCYKHYFSDDHDGSDSFETDDEFEKLIDASSDGQPALDPNIRENIEQSMADNYNEARKLGSRKDPRANNAEMQRV